MAPEQSPLTAFKVGDSVVLKTGPDDQWLIQVTASSTDSNSVLQWQQANSQLEAVAIIGPETLLLREKREIDTNTFGYALIAARVDNGKILRVDYNGTAPEGQLPTVDENFWKVIQSLKTE